MAEEAGAISHAPAASRLDASAEDWKAVNEDLQKSCRYVIKNLTTGDRLKIRVVALNAGGRSAPVALPEAILVKEVAAK
ncbi:Myosin-binding protein C, fast-type [Liparis tanakae]|uniref:Myosin-binding protein C, fast-type n=1 Tax=Liparis tanakae TaxID=230148 RepID=A0A4Z2FYB1_9TELE|nr:Myosin-binding protein C, fast-type [Liparis tanakae]